MKYLITILICISMGLTADGTIGGVTYFDFFNSDKDDSTAFNFQRQYFSYADSISDDLQFTLVFDVGRTDKLDGEDARLVAYLKKAQIDFKTSLGKASMGLIGMNTHAVQEKNWGNRFIEKSALDKNKYSTAADLGIGFSCLLKENLTMSVQMVNGEGYKQSQRDKYYKISFNTTYGEVKLNNNDGYNAGIVYSTEGKDTTMISTFVGFAGMGLRICGEYDMLTKGAVESNIISVSANYGIKNNMDAFVRYDMFDDNDLDNKNGNNYLITGVVIKCNNGISVSPNMRITSYEDPATVDEKEYKINFQFKF